MEHLPLSGLAMQNNCPRQIIVYGTGQLSSLAWYCLSHDSEYEVMAFTVDGDYLDRKVHHGLPVVAFEEIVNTHPPDRYGILIPIGYRNINGFRQSRYEMAKRKSYRFATYVSSRASVWPDLNVGENSMIYEQAVIQPFAKIGCNTIIRSGAHVSHHAIIGNHCFMAAHAVVAGNAEIQQRCFLGLNSTIRDNITVAPQCIIAAGALVLESTIENSLYVGVPAVRANTAASNANLE